MTGIVSAEPSSPTLRGCGRGAGPPNRAGFSRAASVAPPPAPPRFATPPLSKSPHNPPPFPWHARCSSAGRRRRWGWTCRRPELTTRRRVRRTRSGWTRFESRRCARREPEVPFSRAEEPTEGAGVGRGRKDEAAALYAGGEVRPGGGRSASATSEGSVVALGWALFKDAARAGLRVGPEGGMRSAAALLPRARVPIGTDARFANRTCARAPEHDSPARLRGRQALRRVRPQIRLHREGRPHRRPSTEAPSLAPSRTRAFFAKPPEAPRRPQTLSQPPLVGRCEKPRGRGGPPKGAPARSSSSRRPSRGPFESVGSSRKPPQGPPETTNSFASTACRYLRDR